MTKTAAYWIDKLNLSVHPEGGHYRESYRSPLTLARKSLPHGYEGDRAASTAIYFLLAHGQVSLFHRLKSDEIWHFYDGACLNIHQIDGAGVYRKETLGPNFENGEQFQIVVRHNTWVAAEVPSPDTFTLVGCTVAPGFEFADFEMGDRETLVRTFPECEEIIRRCARPQ